MSETSPSAIQASKDLAAWIHAQLSGSDELATLLGDPARLYDYVPDDPVYPYLTYGPMRTTDLSGDGVCVLSHALSLHVWSRYSGRAEVLQVLAQITTLLGAASAREAYPALIGALVTYSDTFRAPDGRTLHGLLRLNFTTHHDLETTP